jgi:hypothetical protein
VDPIELLMVFAIIAIVIVVILKGEKQLADPSNQETIFVQNMNEVCTISVGPVEAVLIRQSGNQYRHLGEFQSASVALEEIKKSFSRAKIDSLHVLENSENTFSVTRLHHSHRGQSEGKKLGSATLKRL